MRLCSSHPHPGDTEQLAAAFWGDYNTPWGCSGGKALKSKELNDLEIQQFPDTVLPVGRFELESMQRLGPSQHLSCGVTLEWGLGSISEVCGDPGTLAQPSTCCRCE